MSDENHHRHHEQDGGSVVDVDTPPNVDGPTANEAATANGDGISNNGSESSLAKGLSSIITSVMKDFDSKAEDTVRSQDQLSFSIDRLTRELDQLLEDAPLPFIMQHAGKISVVRKRVSSLNTVVKSIQRRVDNIDRMLSSGVQHGIYLTLGSIF
ncbi:hypothetical protein RJ640_004993, partial [Escallonia rubra]